LLSGSPESHAEEQRRRQRPPFWGRGHCFIIAAALLPPEPELRPGALSFSQSMFDFSDIALDHEFPVRRNFLYFNNHAPAPLPRRVGAAIGAHLENARDRGAVDWRGWYAAIDETREKAGKFLGAAGREIAFVPSTSWGVNLVAQ